MPVNNDNGSCSAAAERTYADTAANPTPLYIGLALLNNTSLQINRTIKAINSEVSTCIKLREWFT
jgi:hypothetical protein